MLMIVWVVLIYWLVFFVACFAVVELMWDWFYDERLPNSGLRVGAGSLILAGLAAWLRPSFDTMFTSDIAWTLLQAVVWFVVFALLFQFHLPHALAASLGTMVLFCGLASLGVDSLTRPSKALPPARSRQNNEPIRRSLTVPVKTAK